VRGVRHTVQQATARNYAHLVQNEVVTEPTGDGGGRLDSWKAIADYLDRDVATVRRWEKSLGLPVRRVAGGGRSVFAYQSDIDDWLKGEPAAARPSAESAETPRPSRRRVWWMTAAAAAAGIVVALMLMQARRADTPGGLRLDLTDQAVVARDQDGRERWRHVFPSDVRTALSDFHRGWHITAGSEPAVLVFTSHTYSHVDDRGRSGQLMEFSPAGVLRRTFVFDDSVTFNGKRFDAPWALTAIAVDENENGGDRRIAVAAHHFTWDPSLVTILDSNWRRRGTFVHAGWIEALHWISRDRLMIGGYSEAHNGGMAAIVDPQRLDGQGPEAPGTRYYCDSCARNTPLRIVVMPRSEVNRASSSRFNRATFEYVGDRIIAHAIEVPIDGDNAADAVYEFTRDLQLTRASFSARYWDVHDALTKEGKLDHGRDACPDRAGPPRILVWEPQSGWQTIAAR